MLTVAPLSTYNKYIICSLALAKAHFTHETESPWPSHLKHSHWWKSRSRSKFATSHYAWGTNGVYKWMQDACKVYMDSYVASNGSCVMVTWTIFQNHMLEVGTTQNRETIALWTLTTVGLFYFIMCEDPAWIDIHWNSIWLRALSHMTSHYTWRSVTTLHGFGGVLRWPLDTFFWALRTSWSWLLARVWSGPTLAFCLKKT